jgi:uncharacterized protein (TIGR03435 family)
MTAPHVHCQAGVRTFSYRSCVWRLAVAATICVTQPGMMSIWAQTGTVPSPTAPQSAATQKTDALPAALPLTPAFDVASIHPNNSDHTARSHIYSYANQGHFIVINATPMQLLEFAYNLSGSRILGVAAWATSAKYDIEAKSDPALAEKLALVPYPNAKDQLLKMVQLLLADRFHLAAHLESRELPVYELVAAKDGMKFSPVKDGPKNIVDSNSRGGNVSIAITRSSHAMNDLADVLSRYTGRVVLDKTGLSGIYTISLTFTPDDSRSAIPNPAITSADAGPSVFTALKEQLGLELKSSKGRVDVLVVDHIDPPTEN